MFGIVEQTTPDGGDTTDATAEAMVVLGLTGAAGSTDGASG
jgi:hypothetical protein